MKTFKEAYGVLSRHAQTLRNQQEPNIDDLLTIVTESVEAYKVCKERIDAVEAALDKALSDPAVAAEAAAGGACEGKGERQAQAQPADKSKGASSDFDRDDIPF
jgi:exodeoxyribonuclease VII small subunit